jgi:hypothetical protein
MSLSSPSRLSFLLWTVLALVLLLGFAGDLPAATNAVGGQPGMAMVAVSVSRTRVVQIAACAMAFALFIIMRSCKH